jgi:hypothetical protein
LCDLLPLYDFPTDACTPVKEPIQSGNHVADKSVLNRTLIGNKVNQSASYRFERHARPSIAEFILVVWVFTLLCEEVRQVIYSNI